MLHRFCQLKQHKLSCTDTSEEGFRIDLSTYLTPPSYFPILSFRISSVLTFSGNKCFGLVYIGQTAHRGYSCRQNV